MLRLQILLVFLVLVFKSNFGQQIDLCKTISPANDFLIVSCPPLTNATVQAAIHIVRKTNGEGTNVIPISDAIAAFDAMRSRFTHHGICFSLISIDFLDQTTYYNFQKKDSSGLFNHIVTPNAIDIFILPNKNNPPITGISNAIPGRAIIVAGKYLSDNYTLPHEIGHCLGLYHTHHGNASIAEVPVGCMEPGCAEFVDGTNSLSCGDFVQDTPADPCLDGAVDVSCNYVATAYVDPKGVAYNPQTNNIMSYTRSLCAGHFTTGQGIRMLEAISCTQLLLDRLAPPNQIIQNVTVPVSTPFPPLPDDDLTFTASNTLFVGPNVVVNPTGKLNLVAENKVILLPGFIAQFGSHLCAQIGPHCNPIPNCRIMPIPPPANDYSANTIGLEILSLLDKQEKDKEVVRPILSSNNIIPNPSSGMFSIEIVNFTEIQSEITVVILNTLGEIVYQSEITSSQSEINLSSQPRGIYFIKVQSGENVFTEKLVLQ